MVPHLDGFRRTWMFPRNIRKIHPWKINQLISIFTELIRSSEQWSGNQEVQNKFASLLYETGLKDGEYQRDERSGGSRTYQSQLELLGLIFERPNKSIDLTIAGERIFNGEPPLPILQQLLFKFQYPSTYSKSRGVKINSALKVKPFHFVLKMISSLEAVTCEELQIPVMFGHTNDDLNLCIEKIEALRNHSTTVRAILQQDRDLAYTPKTVNRTLEKTLEDLADIANTLKNYLESCHLIVKKPDDHSFFELTDRAKNLLIEKEDLFNDFLNYTSDESFQRSYGSLDRLKDNRMFSTAVVQIDPEIESIKRLLRRAQNQNPGAFDIASFAQTCHADYGLSVAKVTQVAHEFQAELFSQFETSFMNLSVGGTTTASEFEKTVCRLLIEAGFKAEHIGQRYRHAGTGGYPDILVDQSNHFLLIDTKASPNYSFTSNDFYKITGNYIRNSKELMPSKELRAFILVAGNFSSGVNERLQECKRLTGVPTSAIVAIAFYELFKLKMAEKITLEMFEQAFISNSVVTISNYKELIGLNTQV